MKNAGASATRILVVEDEPAISLLCLRTLTGEGFEVDIVVNGLEAQDMLSQKSYDLLIIDIRTPLMNGKQLYQHINERHPELAKRAIFTTGDVIGSDTQHFLEEMGRPYLPKPFTPEMLKTIVREALKEIQK